MVAGSQAEAAGIQRGDILCYAGTNGEEEIMYNEFLALAASAERPLVFDVRRVESKAAKSDAGSKPAAKSTGSSSAEAYARKQAVIAAAEARDKAHKAKTKPIAKGKDTSTLLKSRPTPLPSQQGSQ